MSAHLPKLWSKDLQPQHQRGAWWICRISSPTQGCSSGDWEAPVRSDSLVCVSMCCSAVSDSSQPHRLDPTRLLCPWHSPDKNTGVDCHYLLQEIFLNQGSNPCLLYLLHWQADSWEEPPGKPQLHLFGNYSPSSYSELVLVIQQRINPTPSSKKHTLVSKVDKHIGY